MSVVSWARNLALLSLSAAGSACATEAGRSALAGKVRAANDQFEDRVFANVNPQ